MDRRANTSKANLGSYTKPKWKLGKTTAIRIPEVLKEEVLEYARDRDSGNSGSNQEREISEAIEKLKWAIHPRGEGGGYDGRKAKELRERVKKVIEILEQ